MIIEHNLLSINVKNFLDNSINRADKITEKLSSGYRINCAADDAAGLGISEKMRAQIRGLNRAERNVQDGISLIQTAEGALSNVHDMLQRIHELSVQAANGTCAEIDKNSIQDEIKEIVGAIDGIASNTEFNGIKLLDGTMSKSEVKNSNLSQNSNNKMTLQQLLNSKSKNLNIIYKTDDFETTKSEIGNATASGNDYLKNILQTEIVPQAVNSILRAYSPAFNYLSSSSIGMGLKLYNDASTPVLAAVSIGFSENNGDKKVDNTFLTYTLSVNMASLQYDNDGHLTDQSRTSLETTIVHEMVHGFMDEAVTNGMIGITNGVCDEQNAYPGWFVEGMAQTAAGGYENSNDWVNGNGYNSGTGGLGITTDSSEADIATKVNESNNCLASGTYASKYGTGYLACMYLGYLANGSSNVTAKDISNGLGKILSDLASGKSLNTIINERTNGKYTGVSDFQSKFGDSTSSSFVYRLTQVVGSTGNGGVASGNLSDSDLLSNAPASASLFSLDTKNDTVENIYPSGVNVLSGGGETSGGTAPVSNYSSTISGSNNPNPPINPGSTIDLGNISAIDGIDYDSVRNVLTITKSGNYTLTGANNNVRVVVNDGVKANLTLNNASINTSDESGIRLEGNANVTLNLTGTNKVITSKVGSAGIRAVKGTTLTIQGDGNLDSESINENDVVGGIPNGGAGIGGSSDEDAGNIIINGGTVISKGEGYAAGIGGGFSGTGGNITITGGNIDAESKNAGAGIGGGDGKSAETITITGGSIIAKGGEDGAGIGGGFGGNEGNTNITGGIINAEGGMGAAGIGGGNSENGEGSTNINGEGVIIKAQGGSGASNIGRGGAPSGGSSSKVTRARGIIFEGLDGNTYGNVTLGGALNCDGKTLTVQGGSTLTVLNGGEITNCGELTNCGRIENHGVVGKVSGTGITHHYVTSISKHIIDPTIAIIGEDLSKSISEISPSSVDVSYNGKTRTLSGKWSISDKDGNPVTNLSNIIKDNESYAYTVTFNSEDNIYFDPMNMSMYDDRKLKDVDNLKYKTISDPYVSKSGAQGGGAKLAYSYVVNSEPRGWVPQNNQMSGGIKIQVGANANQSMDIFLNSVKSKDLGIDKLSVLTSSDAENAITASYKAINKISEIRGSLGAWQNRLEHTMSGINSTKENLQSSESRVRDMDMAEGMIEYSKYQIIIKAGQAMLTQANQSPKEVLALLS